MILSAGTSVQVLFGLPYWSAQMYSLCQIVSNSGVYINIGKMAFDLEKSDDF